MKNCFLLILFIPAWTFSQQINPCCNKIKAGTPVDTALLSPARHPSNQEPFVLVKETPASVKRNFSDTSRYAIIYIYRPHRQAASENEYDVFFEEDFMFRALNRSKAIFKILKEGAVSIHARSGDLESTVMVDISFGKKYYLNCRITPGIPHAIPEIRLEEQYDGEVGFNNFEHIPLPKSGK